MTKDFNGILEKCRSIHYAIWLFLWLASFSVYGQPQTGVVWGDWQEWGEVKVKSEEISARNENYYRNPIVPADFSDLDCIRVGDDYYAISSTMQFSPGMTIMHSLDLVNWEIIGHAVSDLSEISNALTWKEMNRYGRGIWAGMIKYYNGRFYVFFGTPDEGYFMTSAERAEGQSVWGLDGMSTFSYSLDGNTFEEFGQYQLSWGYYRGDRIGIYCYNELSENGFIDADYLLYDMK